jgi:hypothetical protein
MLSGGKMKTSNRILLVIIIVILAATTIVIVGFGILFSFDSIPLHKIEKGLRKIISKDFVLKDFSSVNTGGSWELEIEQGNSLKITVTASEYIMDYIKPDISGRTLRMNQVFTADPRTMSLKAHIVMPELSEIESEGNSKIKFSGFNISHLKIKASASSLVTGDKTNIDNLACAVIGSAGIDLSSCSVVNADLDLSWSGKIALHMTGGMLRGKASASAEITCTGDVKELEINASGVKIKKTE